jgi:hypothetical protein
LDNWTWGLSLIALTIAIHVTGVAFMVSVLHSIRVRLKGRNLGLPRVLAIAIGAIPAMGRRRICDSARSGRLKLRFSTPSIRWSREAVRDLCSKRTGR